MDDRRSGEENEPDSRWMEAHSDKESTTNIVELVMPAMLAHPQHERVMQLWNDGKWNIRRLIDNPDDEPETARLDDDGTYVADPEGDHLKVPIVQVYVEDGDEFIEVVCFPMTALGRVLPDEPT